MRRRITWGELRLHLYQRLGVNHFLHMDSNERRVARCVAAYLHAEQEKHHGR